MRRRVLPDAAAKRPRASKGRPRVLALQNDASREMLTRDGRGANQLVPANSASAITRSSDHQAAGDTFKDMLSGALGCKTSETALALLGQVMALEHPTTTMEPERINTIRMNAIAVLGELQPATATEAMLAAQMVGTHRAAMMFLKNATKPDDTFDGRDRNVLRALRLMRLFTEQIEAMSKLKGKSGQQRVVVEHVTVAAGGRAIVGAVIPGGRGASGDDQR